MGKRMRDILEDIGSWIIYAIIAVSFIGVFLFAIAFVFHWVSKFKPAQSCIIEFTDGSKAQETDCDIYRDSTNLECIGANYSMYAVKSWSCK